ncbi:hypothetical protein HMN09_00395000 [Mycena chlorophos]|uniref:Uncharacterized protein n=1 Tax=Mycena chlorophos TaxID=658473 RepID=A0A8H6TG39_MYCCL|nr:hypothetical protein HMN09_00395000 [Mycena chlorophos]
MQEWAHVPDKTPVTTMPPLSIYLVDCDYHFSILLDSFSQDIEPTLLLGQLLENNDNTEFIVKKLPRFRFFALEGEAYEDDGYPTEIEDSWERVLPSASFSEIYAKLGGSEALAIIVCPRDKPSSTPQVSSERSIQSTTASGQEPSESRAESSLPVALQFHPFLKFCRNASYISRKAHGELYDEALARFGEAFRKLADAQELVEAATMSHANKNAMSAALTEPLRQLLQPSTTSLPSVRALHTDGIGRGVNRGFTWVTAGVEILEAIAGPSKQQLCALALAQGSYPHHPDFRPGVALSIRHDQVNVALYLSINRRDHFDAFPEFVLPLQGEGHDDDDDLCLKVLHYFDALNTLFQSIFDHYQNNPKPDSVISKEVFPGNDGGEFRNARRLIPTNDSLVVGDWVRPAQGGAETQQDTVVVKFVSSLRYGCAAHRLAAAAGLAPHLFAFRPATDVTVVDTGAHIAVMSYVPDTVPPNVDHIEALDQLQQFLTRENLVHGDLRLQNVLFGTNGQLKVIDWDWAARYSEPSGWPTYPMNLNRAAYWFPGIVPGGMIVPRHDQHHLDVLKQLAETNKRRGRADDMYNEDEHEHKARKVE